MAAWETRPIEPKHLAFGSYALNDATVQERELLNAFVEEKARERVHGVMKRISDAKIHRANWITIDCTRATVGHLGMSSQKMMLGGQAAREVLLNALGTEEMATATVALSMAAAKGGTRHHCSIDGFLGAFGNCIAESFPGSFTIPSPISNGVASIQIRFQDDATGAKAENLLVFFTHGAGVNCARVRHAIALLGTGARSLFISLFGLEQPVAPLQPPPPVGGNRASFKANKRRKLKLEALLKESDKNDEMHVISDDDHSKTDGTDVVYDSGYESPDILSE